MEIKDLKDEMIITCKLGLKPNSVLATGKIRWYKDRPYICQNVKWGQEIPSHLKYGYKYSYVIMSAQEEPYVSEIKLQYQDINNVLEVGDIIVRDMEKRKILAIIDNIIIPSKVNLFNIAGVNWTLQELINEGWKLELNALDEAIPEYTLAEIKKKLGHDFKIKE